MLEANGYQENGLDLIIRKTGGQDSSQSGDFKSAFSSMDTLLHPYRNYSPDEVLMERAEMQENVVCNELKLKSTGCCIRLTNWVKVIYFLDEDRLFKLNGAGNTHFLCFIKLTIQIFTVLLFFSLGLCILYATDPVDGE